MDAVYTRANDLREKVDAILLKKIEWKILFLVNGQRTIADIAAKVQRDEAFVEEVLAALAEKNLIESLSASEEARKKAIKRTDKKPAGKKVKADDTAETLKPSVVPETKPEVKKEEPLLVKQEEPVREELLEPVIEKPAPKAEPIAKTVPTPSTLKVTPQEPKMETVKPEITPTITEKTEVAGGTKRIMVIDDSVVIQKMVEIALENHPYQLSTAMKGEDAIKAIRENKPNLILLDMMLPDMSGLDVMKAIKAMGAAYQNIPVIILSGKDSPQDKDTAISNGANDFLTKPFHDEDLIVKVKEYIK